VGLVTHAGEAFHHLAWTITFKVGLARFTRNDSVSGGSYAVDIDLRLRYRARKLE
jgi:hypothetical protein